MPSARFVVDGCTIPELQFICASEDWQVLADANANASGNFYFECTGDEYQLAVSTYGGVVRFYVAGGYNTAEARLTLTAATASTS